MKHNPFGSLRSLRDSLPAGDPPEEQPKEAPAPKGPARAVVRYERKGRGGKEVTVVEQLELPRRDLEAWLKALKGSLGCGGAVEDSSLVLQGDHRKRLPALLEGRGVRKISIS
jgi:translation initiation factor 1